MKTIAALAVATATLTACNPNPYAPLQHVTIHEIEAGSIATIGGADLHVILIPEGDFAARCAGNLGGVLRQDWRGYVCIVEA